MNNEPNTPTAPVNPYLASRDSHDRFHALVRQFEANPPPGQVPSQPSSPSASPADAASARIAEFDAHQRAAGLQRNDNVPPGEPDKRALDYLVQLRRDTPADQQTTAWRSMWERDYSGILSGRRYGESPQQWETRKAGQAAPAAEPETAGGEFISPAELTAEHLHGYSLPADLPAELDVHVDTLTSHLAAARQAGITQEQVHAVIRQLAAQAASA